MIKQMGKALRVVELFCGIGGFRIAADNLGMKTVWANDIDDKAVEVYIARFGKTVTKGDIWNLIGKTPDHDILTGGFPCQPFSSAGKKLGVRDSRGNLFEAIVEILKRKKPKYFVLENVKRLLHMEGGRHFSTILEALTNLGYQVEWRLLNATGFGLAQNRERVIITGKLSEQGNDVHLINRHEMVKICSTKEGSTWRKLSQRNAAKYRSWGICRNSSYLTLDPERIKFSPKTPTLKDIIQVKVSSEFDFTESTIKRIGESKLVEKFVDGVEILSNQKGGARMGYTVFGINGVSPTLTASTSRHYERYKVGEHFRRLTNIEYARLQGFPDEHCKAVSVYDQYGLFGNAVPPPMVQWVLKQITSKGEPLKISTQGELTFNE